MSMIIKICIESEYLLVTSTGKFSLAEAKKTFLEMLDAVAKHKATQVLLDGRELTGKPEVIERFFYGKFAAAETLKLIMERGITPVPHFAYVLRKPVLDPQRIGETVAVNRGMIVKTFETLESAHGWLKQTGACQPDKDSR
jgi:hypothetical protein